MKNKDISRRDFLKRVAALSAVAVLPTILTQKASGSYVDSSSGATYASANDKVNLACCGIGNQGAFIINQLYQTGLCNIVALCDTDLGAPHTLDVLKMFPDVPRYRNFREMFDKMGDKIDAVSVGVPDHTHFPICMLAMSLGKHVYVEKPMARTFQENELMMAAAKRHGVVTQMGNQGHSEANYFQFKAWKEADIIKDVYAITAHMNNPRRWHGWDTSIKSMPLGEPIPGKLDWDTWIGSAHFNDYNHDYINGQWRCWYDYGMGALGDWGAHILDTAHEFLDLGLPYEVNPLRLDGHNPYFFPMSSTIDFKFPQRREMPPVVISWYDGVDNIPSVPDGYGVSELDPNIPPTSVGKIQPSKLNPGKEIYSKELTFKGGSHGSPLEIIPQQKALEMASRLPEVPQSPSNHYANFLNACQGKEKTRSPFEIAGPLSQLFCLGVLAQRMGTKLEFDRRNKKITNNREANRLLSPEPRKGWEEFYKM